MMLPQILTQQVQGDSLHLELLLPAELFWFKGHFPQQPILPGVTQLNWVMIFARQALGLCGEFGGFEVMKFQQPLLPGAQLTLDIQWVRERNRLIFSYVEGEQQASSGKIILCP
ncbi:hydroxymyristoyl-ACP dehydratase [Rouxiella sp. T17]|uniref:3-hydroxyacyl-ACP dehydratase FabZ family protein n=1 Tax=Rouxiella sp. T17 TaxID=3085684 RepID=UPI002FC82DC2